MLWKCLAAWLQIGKNFKWNWLCFFKIDISHIPRLNWNVNEQENLQNFDSSSYTVSPHQSWEKYTQQKLIRVKG